MLARALAVNGANKIYILGRRRDVLQECATSVSTGNIIPLVCDVTSKEDLKATALQISSEVGYINLLCCNAGILGPTSAAIPYMGATLSEFVEGQWDMDHQKCLDVFQTNVTSMWFNVVAFLELLNAGNKKKNVDFSSQIVTMSAAGGFNRQSPGTFIYDQSKAAVIHLAKQLSTSLVPYSIRANVIAPGGK
jgi:NAD(P)-dependent dehydrogenase (short-subunit alcohol dehydrogenase family)